MKRTIKLRNVCACGIPAALDALAEEIFRRAGRNHRPCPRLVVLRVERDMVPLPIDLPDCLVTFGLFKECPSPYNPWGKRLLGITMQVCAACPSLHPGGTGNSAGDGDQLQGGKRCQDRCHDECQARCHGCTRACWAEVTVYIKQTQEFPFSPDEVDGFLYRYFNMDDMVAAKIDKDYDFLLDVTRRFQRQAGGAAPADGDDIPNLPGGAAPGAADGKDASPTPQPAQRRKSGAPQLRCNVWLFGQVSALPDPRQCSHLKPRWQELYLEEMGVEPEDWERSFRAAARYCRLLIARGHGDLPA